MPKTSDEPSEEVLLEFPEDHIAVVRINRPKAYNALNLNVRTLIAEKFAELKSRPDIRAVILTGDQKAFAAGADLKEMSTLSAVDYYKLHVERLYNAFADYPRPVIAAVNGFALGGGMELAMISDIILAGQSAKFGQPEVKVGVMPGAGGSQRLVRAVGKYNAMRLCLTGMMIGAEEAKAMGLVCEVLDDDQVMDRALEMARELATLPPLGLEHIKYAILHGPDMSLESALGLERKSMQLLMSSTDRAEATAAFLEKRKGTFTGE